MTSPSPRISPFGPCHDLARDLVRSGVAPSVALGFAVRGARRGARSWELAGGGATASASGSVRDVPVDEAIFDLASVTKPMTAFAVALSGLDRGLPLVALVDEAAGTPSELVPVELLLAHRAGLTGHVPMYAPLAAGREVVRADALRQAASSRRADEAGQRVSGAPPPEGFAPEYSDLGYVLVGEALARHARTRDAGEAIERLVISPLGLGDALGSARALEAAGVDFARRVAPTEVVAWRGGEVRGRVHDENAWALTGSGASGHAGMFGTVGAVLAFGCAVLDALARGDGPLALAGDDLGWLVRPRPGGTLRAGFDGKSPDGASSAGARAGARTFGHLGFTGTSLWIDPDAESVVALLTNRVYPTRENLAIRAARPRAHDALWEMAAMAEVTR